MEYKTFIAELKTPTVGFEIEPASLSSVLRQLKDGRHCRSRMRATFNFRGCPERGEIMLSSNRAGATSRTTRLLSRLSCNQALYFPNCWKLAIPLCWFS
jgi:hypothetical protein